MSTAAAIVLNQVSLAADRLAQRVVDKVSPESAKLPSRSDYRLSDPVKALLQPALSLAGYELAEKERTLWKNVIVHSLAQKGNQQLSLFELTSDFATNPPGIEIQRFASLDYFFEDQARLYLVAKDTGVPNKSLRDIFNSWLRNGRLGFVKWLPWIDLQDLENAAGDTDRLKCVQDLIEVSTQNAPTPQKTVMAIQDKLQLIKILAGMNEFATVQTRHDTLLLLNLDEFTDLPEDSAGSAAKALVVRLEREQIRPELLSSLVGYMLTCNLPSAVADAVTKLQDKYPFLRS
jgi:hypothetical protein